MRYYFHLHNDIESRDEEGREFPHIEAAKAHALAEARTMAAESVVEGHLTLSPDVSLEDDSGQVLARITFGEAVTILP